MQVRTQFSFIFQKFCLVSLLILFFIISPIFLYLEKQIEIHNFLGEKLFLGFHKNSSAIFFLENLPDEKKNYYSHHLLGRIYFVENELEESIKNFTQAIEKNNLDVKSFYGRGLAYGFSQPQVFLKHAEDDFLKILEIYKDNPQIQNENSYGQWAVYNDLAWIYFLQTDFVNQEKFARAGLKISMSNAWLANNLGVALLAQGKCPEAKSYFKNSQNLLENTEIFRFGEAYTGDSPKLWQSGLENMKKVAGENLTLCEK